MTYDVESSLPVLNRDANVSTRSMAVVRHLRDAMLPRTLMGGSRAMRIQRELFLPRHDAESPQAYQVRINKTFLHNAFKASVKNLAGKVFAQPIVLGDDVPVEFRGSDADGITGWQENIDLAGRHLNVFGHDLFKEGLITGMCHVLVDMGVNRMLEPDVDVGSPELSIATTRPYWVLVKSDQVLSYRVGVTPDGIEMLTRLNILEQTVSPYGDWGEQAVQRVRVLIPGAWQLWRDFGQQVGEEWKSDWRIEDEGEMVRADGQPWGRIPLFTFYADRTGFMEAESPLMELAEKNLEHWQSSSEQRNLLDYARRPVLWKSGDEPSGAKQVAWGSAVMFETRTIGAKLEWVEHKGTAIGAGANDLKNLEDQMAVLSLEPLIMAMRPSAKDPTATGKSIDTAEAHSRLQMMAYNLEDAIEEGMGLTAEWAGIGVPPGSGGSCKVNTQYGISSFMAQNIANLIALRAMKYPPGPQISRLALMNEIKRTGILSDDYDAELDWELILAEAQPPNPATVAAFERVGAVLGEAINPDSTT